MLVYLIRHAQSQANALLSSDLNSELTELGLQQAAALASRLANATPRAIYSSPFRRSLLTAAPLARRLDLPVLLRPELAEYHHLPAGTTASSNLADHAQICLQHEGVRLCPDLNGHAKWPPLDEPFDALLARVRGLADYLKSRWTSDDDAVVLIGHGSPIARLIEAWLTDTPGPSFRFVIENAAITALRYYKGISSLVCLNEMSHLAGLPRPTQSSFETDGRVRLIPSHQPW